MSSPVSVSGRPPPDADDCQISPHRPFAVARFMARYLIQTPQTSDAAAAFVGPEGMTASRDRARSFATSFRFRHIRLRAARFNAGPQPA
jgi:hypothetical protein